MAQHLRVVPIKMERAWLTLVNKRRRITACMEEKKRVSKVLLEELERTPPPPSIVERRFPPSRLRPPVRDAVAAPTVRQQYNTLLGDIAILADLHRETEGLAAPYDELAEKKNWTLPVEAALAAAVADDPASSGSEDECDSEDEGGAEDDSGGGGGGR